MKKGEYGNIKARKKREYIHTLVLFLLSFMVLALGIFISGSRKNYLTIVAVLGFLPSAKFLVSSVMFTKAEKYSCSAGLREKVTEVQAVKDTELLYDLYITSYEISYPVSVLFIRKDGVTALLNDEKCDVKKAEEHTDKFFRAQGIKGCSSRFMKEEDKFLKALANATPEPDEERRTAIKQLMLDISL